MKTFARILTIVSLAISFMFAAQRQPVSADGSQTGVLKVEGLQQMCDHARSSAPQRDTDFTTLVFSQILDAVELTSIRAGEFVPRGSLLWSLKPWLTPNHTARISMAKGSYLTLYYTLEDTKANSPGGYVRLNRFLTEEEAKTICAPPVETSPSLDISIDIPTQAVVGHKPLTITVTVKNWGNEPAEFESQVWHGGPAWGREDYPYVTSNGAETYWMSGNTEGITHYWRGKIDPRKSVELTIPTFTGEIVGNHRFVTATITSLPFSLTRERNIELTKPITPPMTMGRKAFLPFVGTF